MRRLLLLLLLLFAVAGAIAAVGVVLSLRGGITAGPRVLAWRLDGPLVEQAPAERLSLLGIEPPLSMAEVYGALRAARSDPGIEGLAVHIRHPAFGLAKAEELHRQLGALREGGKFVACYLETAGEGSNGTLAYYLATACDSIRLSPAGDVNLLGLYAQGMFLRGSLDKLRVEPDFIAVGAYKSAIETYTRAGWSAPAEEALATVLDQDYALLLDAVAGRLGVDVDRARALFDGAPYSAAEALALGLVDELAYPDEFRDHLEELLGEEPRLVPLGDYRRRQRGRRIAVVFASGTLVRGEGGVEPLTRESFLGSDDLAAVLRPLAEDDGVAAVVLRVDSPGGSAVASDLILREVERLGEVKPVVASLSDVAASGGYYIAAKSSRIVAEATTLTGSIGVYGGKLVTRGLEEELLGVSRDTLQRGANADIYSSLTPFSAAQERRLRELMEGVYTTFVDHVAAGRGMSREQVVAVAEGRVWSGADAVRLGLADEVGGLDRAVELAAELAALDPAARLHLEFHPRGQGLLDWLLAQRQPALPLGLRQLRAGLAAGGRRWLELPPEIAALGRPF